MAGRVSILITATVLAWSGTTSSASDRTVRAPRVIGLVTAKAECRLAERGLRWRFHGERFIRRRPQVPTCDGSYGLSPDPRVIRQRPRPGVRLKPRRVVVLYLDGPRWIE